MGKRKAWDLLSESYRQRLLRKGITPESHARGESISGARGHGTAEQERFMDQTRRFAAQFTQYTPDTDFIQKYGTANPKGRIADNLRQMSPSRAREYMRQARAAAKAYESGNYDLARSFWLQRPHNMPEYMFFYHGMFAF